MNEIRIYAEGGGTHEATKAKIRRGPGQFLEPLRRLAQHRRLGWKIVACGGRGEAFDNFNRALKAPPQAFNVLLVDSEAPVTTTPWRHTAIVFSRLLRESYKVEADVRALEKDPGLAEGAAALWAYGDIRP